MENLGIDVKLLLAQGLNFLIFFYIYKKFIAKPFMAFLNEQRKKEEEKARLEEEINKKREEWLKESELKKKELKKELQELRFQLKKEAEEERNKILGEAKKQAQIILEKANREAMMEKVKLESEIKRKISDTALLIVEEGLKDVINNELEKELTANIIKSFKSKSIN